MGQQQYEREIDIDGSFAQHMTLSQVVDLAHRYLGFDAVGVTELIDGETSCRTSAGPWASKLFGLDGNTSLGVRISQHFLEGKIPALVQDTAEELAGIEMPKNAQVRAFLGTPLRLSDSQIYGARFKQ